ncbi:MAG: hypothetical protein SAJ12_00600 [Jaaginema sp. PMC 1079.18]|nr:hypothetical protein [Jaaginema sp. PMC 1080.18]MEC4849482.1 hypothetical protein [Jaaginema sp. PMC 1079.18]
MKSKILIFCCLVLAATSYQETTEFKEGAVINSVMVIKRPTE